MVPLVTGKTDTLERPWRTHFMTEFAEGGFQQWGTETRFWRRSILKTTFLPRQARDKYRKLEGKRVSAGTNGMWDYAAHGPKVDAVVRCATVSFAPFCTNGRLAGSGQTGSGQTQGK
jgi:hypothetical protein